MGILFIDKSGGPGEPDLNSLSGLENVTAIGGYLSISNNASLNTLTGLDNLASIGFDLGISNNVSLCSLTGLQSIDPSTIEGLIIINNSSLSDCAIQSICNYLANPYGSIFINNNAADCENPPEIADECGISLPCLPYGNYYFFSQEDIDDFQTDYPECTDLQGFIFISGDDITNLYGLNEVNSVGDVLWVVSNPYLSNLAGLDQLNYIGGDFLIQGNEMLSALSGLDNLDSVGGRLQIKYNESLADIAALHSLDHVEKDFEIMGNEALTSLGGLENLNYIGGALTIRFNHVLRDLAGLEGLNSIGGTLEIGSNDLLDSLAGLENLTAIGGSLRIGTNNSLVNIKGIANINAETIANLYITFNNSLAICDVKSVCDYVANPSGVTQIFNNAPGCYNHFEVEDACLLGVDESVNGSGLSAFTISPNPASTWINLGIPENTTSGKVSIFSSTGQEVFAKQISAHPTTIDISMLSKGLYFVLIHISDELRSGRFVKK